MKYLSKLKVKKQSNQKIKLKIIYEDLDVLIINKPSGMVVHPGAGNYTDTLVNALIYKYKKIYQILMDLLDQV